MFNWSTRILHDGWFHSGDINLVYWHALKASMVTVYAVVSRYDHVQQQVLAAKGAEEHFEELTPVTLSRGFSLFFMKGIGAKNAGPMLW